MKFSEKGIDKLKELEGFYASPHKREDMTLVVGYGHKIGIGEKFHIISPEQADKMLQKDIGKIEEFISNFLPRMNHGQFDGLVMFIYDIGLTPFLNSKIFSLVKNKNWEEVPSEWKKYDYIYIGRKDPNSSEMVKAKNKIESEDRKRRRLIELSMFTKYEVSYDPL